MLVSTAAQSQSFFFFLPFCVFVACRVVQLAVCAESYKQTPGGLPSPQPPADNGHCLGDGLSQKDRERRLVGGLGDKELG